MKKKTGMVRIIKAVGYSLAGLKAAWISEQAFRQEMMASAILVPAGLVLGQTGAEKALLASSPMLVVAVELMNSGLEAIVDRMGTDFHPLSKQAKDMGSAAVFVCIILTFVVWTAILA